jgi:hypothetical protein
MRREAAIRPLILLFVPVVLVGDSQVKPPFEISKQEAALVLYSKSLAPKAQGPDSRSLKLDSLFFEAAAGRTVLPAELTAKVQDIRNKPFERRASGGATLGNRQRFIRAVRQSL